MTQFEGTHERFDRESHRSAETSAFDHARIFLATSSISRSAWAGLRISSKMIFE